jgi:hypothetical protein
LIALHWAERKGTGVRLASIPRAPALVFLPPKGMKPGDARSPAQWVTIVALLERSRTQVLSI